MKENTGLIIDKTDSLCKQLPPNGMLGQCSHEPLSQDLLKYAPLLRVDISKKNISSAIGLSREGLLGKACQALVSPGVAPNTPEVCDLLRQKHPRGPHPSLPISSSPPVNHVLPHDFNILSVLHSIPKATACGPSGLHIQHLLDAAQVHPPTPICSSLRGVVDILASGRAPVSVSKFLAGGSLTALVKNKEGRPLDIRPIVVGEALRRLTGKCLCIITKPKASDFFTPFQYGVACPAGAEKVIHGVRSSIQEHWKDDKFTVCKVDMSNAFNLVSRQALLEECAVHFTELLPWVGWCYGSHPTLWHHLGQLSSETGVQQGDPLGPLLFSLVLHKLVLSIAQDKDCLSLLSNRWYLDDGVLSGHSQAVTRAVTLIQEMGPSLGLFINVSKCELFGHGDLSSFPPEMKVSRVPNLEILGAPIGDPIFCATKACRCSETPIPIGRSLNLHLEPNEFQVAIKWRLGMDVSFGSCCPYCPNHRLDPLGHHALTCKHGGDVVLRHNSLRDVFVESCHRACLGGQIEVGSGLGLDRLHSCPADVLVNNWHLGKPAAFDLTITSPLNPITLTEAGVRCGSSALFAEVRKHNANDSKCAELGWVCIPLAVESYGCWGTEAQQSFSRLAARLAIQMGCSKSQATTIVYQRLSLSLMRANARALLSRARLWQSEEGG
eukprot:Em0001g193a